MSNGDFETGLIIGLASKGSSSKSASQYAPGALADRVERENLQREVLSLKEQNRQSVCKVAGHLAVRRALRDALAEVAPDHPLANPFDDNPRRNAIFDEASQREWDRYDAK